MGNAESIDDTDGSEIRSELIRHAQDNPDNYCSHVAKAVSILLSDRVVANRSIINKHQCICYYCHPLSRNIFPRGGSRDVIPGKSVKISLNLNIKHCHDSVRTVFNTYRRLYHGTDLRSMTKILTKRRFNTHLGESDSSLDSELDGNQAYQRLNFHTGLVELFDPNQVFMTPEPELAFNLGHRDDGHSAIIQVLFCPSFPFSKGQDRSLPSAEAKIRTTHISQDIKLANKAAVEFRCRVTHHSFADSEVEYYLNSKLLSNDHCELPKFYVSALHFRFSDSSVP